MTSFFSADRKAPWLMVALGAVGASMSGVTFVSVPGNVWAENFYYLPMVLGFCIGYFLIGWLLLPWYYSRNVVSIYSLIGERLGRSAHLTCSALFILSKFISAAVRIYLMVMVLMVLFQGMGLRFVVGVTILFVALLYLYTYKGGVRTLIRTDVLQTVLMIAALVLTVCSVAREMGWSLGEIPSAVASSGYSKVWDTCFAHPTNFLKQLIAGVLVTVAMTGLDQSMMQKHLACRDLGSSRKNLMATSGIILVVNVIFLYLGALLSLFVSAQGGLEALGVTSTDGIFPAVVGQYLPPVVWVIFIIGLICSSYPSAAAAMTSLTTAVCLDFMHFSEDVGAEDARRNLRKRKVVQALVGLGFIAAVVAIYYLNDDSLINLIYRLVSYTYGPLLGIFSFAIFTRRNIKSAAIPWIAISSPVLSYLINIVMIKTCGFDLGFVLLAVNGGLTFIFLLPFSRKVVFLQH